MPEVVDPRIDVGWVEAEQVSPLDEGDAAFVDEAADVADGDAESLATSSMDMSLAG